MKLPPRADVLTSGRWSRLRAWLGYILFAGILFWAISKAPQLLWQTDPLWLLAAVPFVLLNLLFQVIQTRIFLRDRGVIIPGWRVPVHFTLKKAILNVIMPFRTGTLLMLQMLTNQYSVSSIDFVGFMVIASMYSLFFSVMGVIWLFMPEVWFAFSLILFLLILSVTRYSSRIPFSGCVWPLFFLALGLFATFTAALWVLFLGFGHELAPRQTVTMAVILNTLALVNVTPGNMGIREMVMGAIAPLLSVPIAIGILAGAAFFAIRIAVVGLLLWGMEVGIYISRRNIVPPRQ